MALVIEDAINVISPSEVDTSDDDKLNCVEDCAFSLSSRNNKLSDVTPIYGTALKPSESRRVDYKTLKSASSVRNVLLQYGNKSSMASKNRTSTSSYSSYSSYSGCYSGRGGGEKKTIFPKLAPGDAATAIQKNIRRYLVLRKYEINEKERINMRQVVIRDAIARGGGNPNTFSKESLQYKSQHESMNNEINMLVEKLKSFETPPGVVQQILLLLFSCSSEHSDFITAAECSFLLVDVLHLPLSKSEISGQGGILSAFRGGGSTVEFTDLYIWFKKYKEENPYSKPSALSTFFGNFSSTNVPTSFLLRYMDLKARSFDIILSTYLFDKINPPRFQCKYCYKIFKFPMDLAKHQLRCERGPGKGRVKKNRDGDNDRRHRHRHHHHNHRRENNNEGNINDDDDESNKRKHTHHHHHHQRKKTNINDSHSNFSMQSRSRHDKVKVYPSN